MEGGASLVTSELEGGAQATCTACNLSSTLLAVCSASGEVSTYTAVDSKTQCRLSCRWRLHEGRPVQAAWAHPEFGAVLAVLADTGPVTLWAEQPGHGGMTLQATLPGAQACAMAFAPRHLGLQLAVGGWDGRVRVHQACAEAAGIEWVPQTDFEASSSACTCLCWRSASSGLPPLLLVGSERGAQVFCYDGRLMRWHAAAELGSGHTADVAWASTAGGQAAELVATASAATAHVWQLEGRADQLQAVELAALPHAGRVCQVSWNATGSWLATVTEDSNVSLWRPNLAGEWSLQSKIIPETDSEYVMVD